MSESRETSTLGYQVRVAGRTWRSAPNPDGGGMADVAHAFAEAFDIDPALTIEVRRVTTTTMERSYTHRVMGWTGI